MSYPRLMRTAPAPRPGIVHLGPGAFFRAFNAPFTQDAMDASGGDWGIIAVALRSGTARNQLKPQGCAYTAIALTAEGLEHRVINAISDILVASEDPEAILQQMADPHIRIVSLTITEKGYPANAQGELALEDPEIARDLARSEAPRSAIGYIVAALDRRRRAGLRPFTILPCDNLPDNGALIRRLVLDFAAEQDPDLANWIAREARFPATMVDRIAPATTPADIAALADATGMQDAACVVHEPFRQWVIEDNFVDGARPDWAAAGAEMAGSVHLHEAMKLRCLNGSHSALAYLGYLAGHETVFDAVSDPALAEFCKRLWQVEIVPTLAAPEGTDLMAYCVDLMTRFRNPSIQHRTWQIAMDGSKKLPQRLLGTAADNLGAGRDIDCVATAVAAWMIYVGGADLSGQLIDVRDPQATALRQAHDGPDPVEAILAFDNIFASDLAASDMFHSKVAHAYQTIREHGVHAAL
ncbi:mannitol dehydrogenase family protein [Gymnodinialimonas sp. 2305UL16-5]|uniref:mannitol dehydrogenase family protein n=1 Tax=Gymnodinialimonas mytili TaxID=3126503 RepID=UPI0030AA8DA0